MRIDGGGGVHRYARRAAKCKRRVSVVFFPLLVMVCGRLQSTVTPKGSEREIPDT